MADYDHAARLEPFLLLARSTKGASAAKVISDATAAPGVYLFGELLELPGIKALSDDVNHSKSYQLLQLFAYGTLEAYSTNKDSYPPLGPAHLTKLQHLTLVSLALQRRSLPYADLLTALQLSSVRDLENLIIDVIYTGLLAGKMHHNESVFHIDWVEGRDIPPNDLPLVQQRLENWCTTAQNLLAALDERINDVRSMAMQESAALTAYKRFRNQQYSEVQKGGSGGGGGDKWKGNSDRAGLGSTRSDMKDTWGGDVSVSGSTSNEPGGLGSSSRRMTDQSKGQSVDDAFGRKARGSKRQRDL